jgi:hypothetical protein
MRRSASRQRIMQQDATQHEAMRRETLNILKFYSFTSLILWLKRDAMRCNVSHRNASRLRRDVARRNRDNELCNTT